MKRARTEHEKLRVSKVTDRNRYYWLHIRNLDCLIPEPQKNGVQRMEPRRRRLTLVYACRRKWRLRPEVEAEIGRILAEHSFFAACPACSWTGRYCVVFAPFELYWQREAQEAIHQVISLLMDKGNYVAAIEIKNGAK